MISVCNVSKAFGNQVVLSDVSIEIADGETIGIVGPSGAGKSVLLKIITGLMSADSGTVIVDGLNFAELRTENEKVRYASKLGVLFQGAALLDSMSLYENVVFPIMVRDGRVTRDVVLKALDLFERVGLAGFEQLLPGEVSIGVKKRVGIARALITCPKIFLFDEPNTGLDPESGQEIYELIKTLQCSEKFTGVVISHEIPEVFQVCARVAMLYQGDFIIVGSVDEFSSSADPVVQQFRCGEVSGPMITSS